MLLQWEIAEAGKNNDYGVEADLVAHVNEDGTYLSTYGVLQKFAAYIASQVSSVPLF